MIYSISQYSSRIANCGCLILLISLENEPRDTFSDPKIAYAETMKILLNVSSQLNQGAKALEPVAKMNEMTAKSFKAINRSTNIVEKNLKSLDYLQKAVDKA